MTNLCYENSNLLRVIKKRRVFIIFLPFGWFSRESRILQGFSPVTALQVQNSGSK
jgi:hypothetical protein